jgi:uncharacterized protein involved in copper resistance
VSTHLNRKSLVGCLFAFGLMGGFSCVALAVEERGDPSPATSADAPNKTATTSNEATPNHATIPHTKMRHESMDHDQENKKAD